MRSPSSRLGLVALLALLLSCSDKAKEESTSAGDAQGAPNAAAPGTASVEDLGALVDLVVAEANGLPRAEFDPAALATALGKNPQAQFDWVRDRTWWAPYRGLLRGPKGVMLDRIGSNLDRAALLGDLLRRSGHNVRLAHAVLPEARARELLGKLRPIPDQRGVAASRAPSADRQRESEKLMPGFEASLNRQLAESKRVADEAAALVRAQAGELQAMVRGGSGANAADDRAAVAAMRDHWWVEREENGQWIAMDVLLPDAKVGDTLAAASARSEWNAKNPMPSIPDSDWHSVRVSVAIERYENGAISEATVLEAVLRPAETLGTPVALIHKPKPWPAAVPDPSASPSGLGDAAVSVKEWAPLLQVGDELIAQSAFTEGGDPIAAPFSANRDIAAAGGGGFMTGFGEQLGAEGGGGSSSLTAEWIDYEIQVPGEKAQKLRRPVFDLLGPTNRAAKSAGFDASTNDRLVERYEALLSRTDILLQPCDFSGDFVASLAVDGIVAEQTAIKELVREGDPAKAKILKSEILSRIDDWSPLPDLAVWRKTLGHPSGNAFIGRPNILNYRMTRTVVNTDRTVVRESIDVAANSVGVRPGAARSPFEVRMHQGVADTVAETLILGSDLRGSENTASLFAIAGPAPERGTFIAARDAASAQKLGWPPDAALRLTASVDAGYSAVALTQPVSVSNSQRVGWWRVDPESGETIGVMDTGLHAAMTEKEITDLKVALRQFLKDETGYWRFLRGRIARGDRFSQATYNELWMREAAMQVLRDLVKLGL